MHRPRPLSLSTHPSPAHLPSLNPYLENIRVALASLAVCCRKPLRGTSAPGSRRGLGDLPQLLRPPISVSSWAEPAWPDDSSSQKLFPNKKKKKTVDFQKKHVFHEPFTQNDCFWLFFLCFLAEGSKKSWFLLK